MDKELDMMRYYKLVNYCCCFKDSMSTEKQNIMGQIYYLNRVLDEPYKLSENDRDSIIEFYKEYRSWLLERYMNRYYLFSGSYENLYSRKNRGEWKLSAFEEIYGNASKEVLFFAQTFNDYSQNAIDELEALESGKDSSLLLTAHKMRLGVAKMLVIIGYSRFEWVIPYEESIIQKWGQDI